MEIWKRRLSHDGELNEVVSSSVIWNSTTEWVEWNDFKSQHLLVLLFLFAIIIIIIVIIIVFVVVDYIKIIPTQ